MAIEIKDDRGHVLATVDADTLVGADLHGLDLRNAKLQKRDMTGANLSSADLTLASMQYCSLDGADLRNATLTEHLYRATLHDALLDGATIHWRSAEVVSELLRRAAQTEEQRAYAIRGLTFRECWDTLINANHPLIPWATDTLAPYVQDGDNAPEFLKHAAAVLAKKKLAAS
jgi:Pentapeptide repeats (8 copies)